MDLTASATGPGSGAACRPTPPVTLHSPVAECGPSESPPAWASAAAMSLLGQDGACLTHLSPSPPWREQQAPAGAGLGACRAPDCCRGPSMGPGWQAPGRPVSGTSMPQLSPQHRLKTAAAAAWGRGGMPPHSTRRPNPPCPAGRPAVRRASESLPARAGLGLPCYGPPWPSNTGQSYLPLLRPRGASGKLRQVQDSELAGLGLQRALPLARPTGAFRRPFADSA